MISMTISDNATPYLERVYGQEMTRVATNLTSAAAFVLGKFKTATAPSPNFSLKQLEKMGYPYGILPLKKGAIPRAKIPHRPYWKINRQTGQLHEDLATSQIFQVGDTMFIQVGLKQGSPTTEYARHVIYGTKKMIGRNFMAESVMNNLTTIKTIMIRTRVRRGRMWSQDGSQI